MPSSPRKNPDSSRLRQLLSNSPSDNTSDPSLTKCVDVYLCDNCDKDFDSLQDLINHERGCGKKEVITLEEGVTPQEAFLARNLKLCSRGGNPPLLRKLKVGQRPKASSYDKFMDIELSSPLVKYIVSSSKLGLEGLQEIVMKEKVGEEQEQSLCVGEGGAGCEGPILFDHEQEEGGVDGAQAVVGSKNMFNDGEGEEIVGQREVNNSGQGGEEAAHLDENQNKESDRDLINNEAEDPVVEKFCHSNLKKDRCLCISFLSRIYT